MKIYLVIEIDDSETWGYVKDYKEFEESLYSLNKERISEGFEPLAKEEFKLEEVWRF